MNEWMNQIVVHLCGMCFGVDADVCCWCGVVYVFHIRNVTTISFQFK